MDEFRAQRQNRRLRDPGFAGRVHHMGNEPVRRLHVKHCKDGVLRKCRGDMPPADGMKGRVPQPHLAVRPTVRSCPPMADAPLGAVDLGLHDREGFDQRLLGPWGLDGWKAQVLKPLAPILHRCRKILGDFGGIEMASGTDERTVPVRREGNGRHRVTHHARTFNEKVMCVQESPRYQWFFPDPKPVASHEVVSIRHPRETDTALGRKHNVDARCVICGSGGKPILVIGDSVQRREGHELTATPGRARK